MIRPVAPGVIARPGRDRPRFARAFRDPRPGHEGRDPGRGGRSRPSTASAAGRRSALRRLSRASAPVDLARTATATSTCRAGSTAAFARASTPFRGVSRQRHAIDARDNLLLTFLLPVRSASRRRHDPRGPAARRGSRPTSSGRSTARAGSASGRRASGSSRRTSSCANGVRRRSKRRSRTPTMKFLATNETGPLLCPPPLLVTAELPGRRAAALERAGDPARRPATREAAPSGRSSRSGFPKASSPDRSVHLGGRARRIEHVFSGPSTSRST